MRFFMAAPGKDVMDPQLDLWPQARPMAKLRWSVSRARRLGTCARQYYLYHYASLGGRGNTASATARQFYVLKQLRSRFMLLGEVVHERVQHVLEALRQGSWPPQQAVLAQGAARLRTLLAEAAQGTYLRRPGLATGLVEHAYDEPLGPDIEMELQARLQRCIANFYALPLLQDLAQTPSYSWLALETFGSFALDGATVVVKPDVAFRNAQREVTLVDWKSGTPSPADRAQLAVYGLYAGRAWGQGSGPMRAQLAYLKDAQVDAFALEAEALAAALAETRSSIARMQALRELDPGRTQPPAARFAPTLDAHVCARCVFRGACGAPAAQAFAHTLIAPLRRG